MSTKGIESSDGGIEGMSSENKEFFQPQFLRTYFRVDQWIREPNKGELLKYVDDQTNPVVNLSGDPVLHVVIAYGESKLACELIDMMQKPEGSQRLLDMKNKITKDTALHVAASMGDETVAEKLLNTDFNLLHELNEEKETPLHKAAFYGQSRMFKMLESVDTSAARTADGNTILHCAILSNTPDLALHIARNYPQLMESRNKNAVTPFQLLVTIPDIFRKNQRLMPLDRIIYTLIPLDGKDEEKLVVKDLENPEKEEQIRKIHVDKSNSANYKYEWESIDDVDRSNRKRVRVRAKLPKTYGVLFDILDIVISIWKRLLKILRARHPKIEKMCCLKEKYKNYMKLIAFLAYKPSYWEFLEMGRSGKALEQSSTTGDNDIPPSMRTANDTKNASQGKETSKSSQEPAKKNNERWNESPLILGAKMGLNEFVEQILKVCPTSSLVLDQDGHNILQVAIDNGQDRIVDLIELMTKGPNPVMSLSRLTSAKEKVGKSIGHFAAKATIDKEYASPLQLRHELRWLKRVQKLLPKYRRYSRNQEEKTAGELFTELHKEMLNKAKSELTKTGEICSGLVAAVVFASSFSIPGDKVNGKPMYMNRVAFKVFSHAYVIGLSCASTALVLFLSFAISQYREEDFKSYVPIKYLFAVLSFVMALLALLVAFSCNIYLSIYGGEKVEAGQVIPFVCELLVLPTIFLVYLLIAGRATLGKKYEMKWFN